MYPHKALEIMENGQMLFTALTAERDHYDIFTTELPVYLDWGDVTYVRSVHFFLTDHAGSLHVDGEQISELVVRQESQLRVPEAKVGHVIEALKKGREAVVNYASSMDTATSASFSAMGFTRALQSIGSSASLNVQASDPIELVASNLKDNRFGVRPAYLRRKTNPRGRGHFVFVEKTRYFDFRVERLFIWFVHDNVVIKLNGATHNLTPHLPFPREAPLSTWDGTGLEASQSTPVGLQVAFGQS